MDKLYVIPLIIVFIVAGAVYAFNFSPQSAKEPEFETSASSEGQWMRLDAKPNETEQGEMEEPESKIKIYITGEIVSPGVYELDEDSRVVDAVEVAGGVTAEADLERINLSQRIYDEQHITVDRIIEPGDPATPVTLSPTPPPVKAKTPTKTEGPKLININTATQDELEALPNVGAVTAGRIIVYREQNGGFDDIEDIMNVERIGEKTFEALKDLITTED